MKSHVLNKRNLSFKEESILLKLNLRLTNFLYYINVIYVDAAKAVK
jgi:hypothetical protein